MSIEDVEIGEILGLLEEGVSSKDIAVRTGCSVSKIQQNVAALLRNQGVLEQYRSVQHLQLTEIQARVLDSITDEMLANANLKDLTAAFKVLKDKEQTDLGKPTEIKGLVAYLVHLEQEDLDAKKKVSASASAEPIIEGKAEEIAPTIRTKKPSFVDGVPQF